MKFPISNFQFSKRFAITTLTVISLFLLLPNLTQSAGLVPCGLQTDNPLTFYNEKNPCGFCDFFVLFNNILTEIFKLVPAVAALILVFAGFKFFLAAEDPNQVADARKMIISVIIGLVIIYSAWAFVGLFLSAIDLADWTENIFRNWWTNGLFQINCPA